MTAGTITCGQGRVTIHVADVFAGLARVASDSVDCCVTSPPYWGLRDYGVDGQIGMEPTLGEHLDVMVRVFAEVFRTLKPGGTLFLNYGDCYATAPNGRSAADTKAAGADDRTFRDKPFSTSGLIYDPRTPNVRQSKHPGGTEPQGRIRAGGTLKPTDLCMIPNRLAIALQEWGWHVRSEIVWGKPNPMPDSSGRYRPSTAHEKIFLLTKSAAKPVVWSCRETGVLSRDPDLSERVERQSIDPATGMARTVSLSRWIGHAHWYDAAAARVGRQSDEDSNGYPGSDGDGVRKLETVGNTRIDKQRGHSRRHAGFNDRWDQMSRDEQRANGRFLRNYETAPPEVWEIATKPFSDAHFATFPPDLVVRALACGCPPGGAVLDPFGGAGTTGLVAAARGHTATLIELNPDYAAMAAQRIDGLFNGKTTLQRRPVEQGGQVGLFDMTEAAG